MIYKKRKHKSIRIFLKGIRAMISYCLTLKKATSLNRGGFHTKEYNGKLLGNDLACRLAAIVEFYAVEVHAARQIISLHINASAILHFFLL